MAAKLPQSGSGKRYIVQQFAAHLAHLLNTGERLAKVNPFVLFQTLISTLSSAGSQSGSNNYRDHILGYRLVAADAPPEHIAQKYFDIVLDRPLFLARNHPMHTAHRLFEALCQRGQSSWEDSKLERIEESNSGQIRNTQTPNDFQSVWDRLSRLSKDISPGNPAITRKAEEGPIYLIIEKISAEVAEEMSVWEAVSCCPAQLKKLQPGPEFNRFCSLVIKAVEAANAPYGAIISLGLSPFDWGDELTINTAKKISAFIHEVNGSAEKSECSGHHLDEWRKVWEKRKIPGFKSAQEFWDFPIGRHFRAPVLTKRTEISIDTLASDTEYEAEFMDEVNFNRTIETYRKSGNLSDFDAWFLQELYQGTSLSEIMNSSQAKQVFGLKQNIISEYAENLRDRMTEIMDDY